MARQTPPDTTGTDEDGTEGPEDPPPAPAAPPPDPSTAGRRSNRFFAWMRALGLQRQPGWVGGVCSGIAIRLDIDPLIVRGIVVIIAVLGGPAFIVYAAAWLLLPDQDDKIHLENLGRGRVESPIAGIGALILLSMLPMAQGFWYLGSAYWGAPSWGYDLGRALWTIVLLAVVVAFVVWIARRADRNSSAVPSAPIQDSAQPSSAPVFSPAMSTPATGEGGSDPLQDPATAAAWSGSASFSTAPGPPPAAPAADASAEELTAWRERQERWKQQNREFRNAAAASQREVRQRRAAEYRERARRAAAEAAEFRRVRRLENPALSAPIVLAVFGAAVVSGGVAAVVSSVDSTSSSVTAAIGLAVAAIVMGLAIAVGGMLRHRSGFLAFLAGVTLMLALAMTAVPTGRTLLGTSSYGLGVGDYVQPLGNATVTTLPDTPAGVTDLWQGSGTVTISIEEGTAAIVEVTSPASSVTVWALAEIGNDVDSSQSRVLEPEPAGAGPADGPQHWVVTVGDPSADTIRTVRIWQNSGYVEIVDNSTVETEGATQ